MTDLKRTIKCSNCSSEATIYINSEFEMSELSIAGRCNRCGNSMQINYSIIDKTATESTTKSTDPAPLVNLDESLFTPEIPTDAIRDLMEE